MTLGEFLREAAAPGPWNCSTMPADWCVALGHPDFAAAWRDTTDEVECETAAVDAGGLAILWGRGIGEALPMVEPPFQAGDIGVICTCGLEAGAIYTGERWAVRTPKGVSCAALPDDVIVVAWRP